MEKLEAGGKLFNILWTTGTVVAQTKLATTSVHGSGGGSSGSGYSAPVSISSSTTIHNDIFIKDENGKEHSFQLSDFDIACHEGSKVSVVWGILDGKQTGSYVLVMNHDTANNYFASDKVIDALYGPWKIFGMGCLALILVVVATVTIIFFGGFIRLLLVFVAVTYGSIFWKNKQSKSFIRKFKSELLALNIK
jgi:hypothetical protein